MSPRVRIRIDRLTLDGAPPGTRPSEIEAALRAELARALAHGSAKGAMNVPTLHLDAASASPRALASATADGIARLVHGANESSTRRP